MKELTVDEEADALLDGPSSRGALTGVIAGIGSLDVFNE